MLCSYTSKAAKQRRSSRDTGTQRTRRGSGGADRCAGRRFRLPARLGDRVFDSFQPTVAAVRTHFQQLHGRTHTCPHASACKRNRTQHWGNRAGFNDSRSKGVIGVKSGQLPQPLAAGDVLRFSKSCALVRRSSHRPVALRGRRISELDEATDRTCCITFKRRFLLRRQTAVRDLKGKKKSREEQPDGSVESCQRAAGASRTCTRVARTRTRANTCNLSRVSGERREHEHLLL